MGDDMTIYRQKVMSNDDDDEQLVETVRATELLLQLCKKVSDVSSAAAICIPSVCLSNLAHTVGPISVMSLFALRCYSMYECSRLSSMRHLFITGQMMRTSDGQ